MLDKETLEKIEATRRKNLRESIIAISLHAIAIILIAITLLLNLLANK